MEGRGGSRENTGLFFFFLTPPPPFFLFYFVVSGCQAATVLSWPFFESVGNSVGPPCRAGQENDLRMGTSLRPEEHHTLYHTHHTNLYWIIQ